MQTGRVGPPKILKIVAECSLKRIWMTLLLVLNIPLIHPLDPLERRLHFKVTGFKSWLYFHEGTSVRECEHYMEG
jgi:hypothetical protein